MRMGYKQFGKYGKNMKKKKNQPIAEKHGLLLCQCFLI